MRVGILTFHKAVNYGAFLQAFSLSNMLAKRFPDDKIEIVDYIAPKERRHKIYVILRALKHYGPIEFIREIKRVLEFARVQKHLPRSDKSFSSDDLGALYDYIEQRYDLLIIGSDAVFNWHQTDYPTAFIPTRELSIPILTYAASVHGMKYLDESEEKLTECGKAFRAMSFVGVRDLCTERFVKHCAPESSPVHLCDPTVFIDTEKLAEIGRNTEKTEKMLEKKYSITPRDKYIVLMVPDSPLVKAIADKYRGEYKILSVFVRSACADIYVSDLDPFEWAAVLRGACAVISSYFHGILLSLVQGTPALAIDYSDFRDDANVDVNFDVYEGKLCDLMRRRLTLPELYCDRSFAESSSTENSFGVIEIFDRMLCGDFDKRIAEGLSRERDSFEIFAAKVAEISDVSGKKKQDVMIAKLR